MFRSSLALGVLALALACSGTPSPAPTEPTPTSPTDADVPDGPAPPMYKPSSRSTAPMDITDPAYGAYGDAADAPGLGATLPDFEVALADGGSFSLAQARAAGPVLVMFYRGFW
ncbi:MAG: hypothetical protein AB1Z98_01205 [Nannocystaceae bacterium]